MGWRFLDWLSERPGVMFCIVILLNIILWPAAIWVAAKIVKSVFSA